MRTYRRQNPAAAPPRNIPAPMPRAVEEASQGPSSPAEEPVRGEIPSAPPPAADIPPVERKAVPPPADDDGSCRPHYPLDPTPAAGSAASCSSPAWSGQPAAGREQTHPGPGLTLFPDPGAFPAETAETTEAGEAAEPEAEPEEEFIPPAVVNPPEDDAVVAFPGKAEAREVSAVPAVPTVPATAPSGASLSSDEEASSAGDSGQTSSIPGEGNPLSGYIPPAPPDTGIAPLRVWVTTARQAIPIEGARVVITKEGGGENQLVKILTTNQDGSTATVDLPAVPAEYSQKPGYPHPYTLYTIEISKPGYFTIRNNHVPLYGGITTVQPADLIPLPEEEGLQRPEEIVIDESGPDNLQ